MKVLIVNPFGIGDVLFTTPLIHAIKEKFPQDKLGYLCNKRTAPLLENNPFINEVFIYERDDFKRALSVSWFKWFSEFGSFIKRIKACKFDLAIDLSLTTHFGFFVVLTGIRKRIGYNYKNRGFFLTRSIKLSGYEDKLIVDYYNGLLKLIGIEPKYQDLELYLKDEDKQYAEDIFKEHRIDKSAPVIAIAPGGGASWGIEAKIKHWPVEKFVLLIDKIIEKYKVIVIILGDLKEKDLFLSLEKQIQDKAVNLIGKTTLSQSAAIIYKSDIFIGNDGGPLHIAASLGKKTISFFGPVDPKVYGPYPPDEKRHIVLRRTLECSPCYRRFRLDPCQRNKECLEKIDLNEALSAVKSLLENKELG